MPRSEAPEVKHAANYTITYSSDRAGSSRWRIHYAQESPTQIKQSREQKATRAVHGVPRAAASKSGPVPPTQENPFRGRASKSMALARVRSSQGKGALAWLRAAPTDHAREIPPNEFVYTIRRMLGVEELLATGCPRCRRGREYNTITTNGACTNASEGWSAGEHA